VRMVHISVPRHPIPTHNFSLVVCKLGRRILLVHERKHHQLWYFPAGRVESGETFMDAALRETKEEAGISVELEGILRVQRSVMPGYARQRVLFLARPADDRPPKSVPDQDSLEARFVTLQEMERLPLRGDEVLGWSRYVLQSGAIAPLSLLTREDAPP
jgi:8-oxo-dGTP pyrophosphatase MutT (NUDIX family)